jgi:hypothetical protein
LAVFTGQARRLRRCGTGTWTGPYAPAKGLPARRSAPEDRRARIAQVRVPVGLFTEVRGRKILRTSAVSDSWKFKSEFFQTSSRYTLRGLAPSTTTLSQTSVVGLSTCTVATHNSIASPPHQRRGSSRADRWSYLEAGNRHSGCVPKVL